MTTLIITLSQQDEQFLRNMMANRSDVKTLEEAVLRCIRERVLLGPMRGTQPPTRIQLEQTRDRNYTPILRPRPSPKIASEDERFLVISGDEESIEGMISVISKGISLP